MSFLKRYWWVFLLPGGFIVALILKARSAPKAPVGVDVGTNASSVLPTNRAADVTAVTQNLVADAETQSATLRASLANDPLAATLLGISPTLVGPGADPATAAKRAALQAQLVNQQNDLNAAAQRYSINHDGGLNANQESDFIAQKQAAIDATSAQLTALGA